MTNVIDKSKEDLWKTTVSYSSKGFHVVSDANDVKTLQKSFNHLASGGRLVVYGMFYFCIVIYFCLETTVKFTHRS